MNTQAIASTLYQGPPSFEGRPDREIRTYQLLEQLKIPYDRMEHAITASIEDCLEVEQYLGTRICKNLCLCSSQKTTFYLLLMPGTKQFKTSQLSKQIHSSRLSFVPSSYLPSLLGLEAGSVSILGLMNDTTHQVRLLIDEDILMDEYLGCHPCINTASLRIRMQDILTRFLPYTGHLPTYVHLS